jgi:hypothetical protein
MREGSFGFRGIWKRGGGEILLATSFRMIDGSLHRDGKPFIMKGMGYSPVPIGTDPEIGEPWGDYFTSHYSFIDERDPPVIRKMGASILRTRRLL